MLMEELQLNSKRKKYTSKRFARCQANVVGIMTGEITLLSLFVHVWEHPAQNLCAHCNLISDVKTYALKALCISAHSPWFRSRHGASDQHMTNSPYKSPLKQTEELICNAGGRTYRPQIMRSIKTYWTWDPAFRKFKLEETTTTLLLGWVVVVVQSISEIKKQRLHSNGE